LPGELLDAAERRDAVAEALASIRAEGIEPSEDGLSMLDAIAAGRISTAAARETLLHEMLERVVTPLTAPPPRTPLDGPPGGRR
jgi:hypothetical protein